MDRLLVPGDAYSYFRRYRGADGGLADGEGHIKQLYKNKNRFGATEGKPGFSVCFFTYMWKDPRYYYLLQQRYNECVTQECHKINDSRMTPETYNLVTQLYTDHCCVESGEVEESYSFTHIDD